MAESWPNPQPRDFMRKIRSPSYLLPPFHVVLLQVLSIVIVWSENWNALNQNAANNLNIFRALTSNTQVVGRL